MNKQNKVFNYFTVPALFLPLIGAILYYIILTDPTLIKVTYTILKIIILGLPLLCFIIFRDDFKKLFFRFDKLTKKDLLAGLLTGVFIAAVIFGVYFLFRDYFNSNGSGIVDKVEQWGILDYYLYFAVFLSIIHSLLEEYFWRWFVFQGLQIKFKVPIAIAIASVTFSAHHFVVLSEFFSIGITILFGVLVGVAGAVWCTLFEKSKNFLPVWISHFFADMAIMICGYLIIIGNY